MKNLTQKNKSTEELTHEIKSATDIEDYLIQKKRNCSFRILAMRFIYYCPKKKSAGQMLCDSLPDRAYVY